MKFTWLDDSDGIEKICVFLALVVPFEIEKVGTKPREIKKVITAEERFAIKVERSDGFV